MGRFHIPCQLDKKRLEIMRSVTDATGLLQRNATDSRRHYLLKFFEGYVVPVDMLCHVLISTAP